MNLERTVTRVQLYSFINFLDPLLNPLCVHMTLGEDDSVNKGIKHYCHLQDFIRVHSIVLYQNQKPPIRFS